MSTDYSDWVLKDRYGAVFTYGPKKDSYGVWHYLVEFESGAIETGTNKKVIEDLFQPPVVWTYYFQNRQGDLKRDPLLNATHRSCDGGDTIERIKDE